MLAAGLAACQTAQIEAPAGDGGGGGGDAVRNDPAPPAAVAPAEQAEQAGQPPWQPAQVGLLIPLQGPLASAGRAVRDGFIAAYLHRKGAAKPGLRIYDSVASPMPALHRQCLADGIELIVGPLSKENLAALRDLNPQIPVLGLNYLDERQAAQGEGPENALAVDGVFRRPLDFRQLGLAIEDEAASIAERLRGDGIEQLLVVRNGEDWALRGSLALASDWPFEVHLHAFEDAQAITESVGEAMRVAGSLERREALQKLLGQKLHFLPRSRTDLDAVVAFVNHLEAAALAPALHYHSAQRLPVYASSQSARNPSALEELDGFQIAEMPFQLNANGLSKAVQQAFDLGSGDVAAFYALGIDAWRILNRWRQMAGGESVQGATGELQLGADGRIRRRLAWGEVSGGAIRPLPVAPAAPAAP